MQNELTDQTHLAVEIAVSPDQKSLVTIKNCFIHFWYLPTGRLIGSLPMKAKSIAFSSDGNELYVTVRNRHFNMHKLRVIAKHN